MKFSKAGTSATVGLLLLSIFIFLFGITLYKVGSQISTEAISKIQKQKVKYFSLDIMSIYIKKLYKNH